ncbi:MAG: FMN-binding protein [bacterium]|nr:FMN-binding protein [bacterium]
MKNKIVALLLCGMLSASVIACGDANKTSNEPSTATASPEAAKTEHTLKIGQVYTAAHGTKSFALTTVVVENDTIVSAYLDEFQFFGTDADITGVPNSDEAFADGFAKENVLGSKRTNTAYYSELMKSVAKSTVAINDNFDAIQAHTVGKTVAELETLMKDEKAVDAVSGATLADTANYVGSIVEAARAAQNSDTTATYNGDLSALTLKVSYGKPHGTKSFGTGAVLTDGTKVILSYIDEFQFLTNEDGVVGVPNSDADFAAGYADGVVLASKRVNNKYYSDLMVSHAKSTVAIEDNFNAIQSHVNGMEISAVTALAAEEKPVDAITGATLADTAGYLNLLVETTK